MKLRLSIVATVFVVLALAASPWTMAGDPDRRMVGGVTSWIVRAGDTLASIGARAGVATAVLAEQNGIAPTVSLHPGQLLRIDNRHIVPAAIERDVLTINIPQRMLFYQDDNRVLRAFPVAVGRRGWATPIGAFTVTSRRAQPTWVVPQSIRNEARRQGRTLPERVPPGPHNPLGAFWLGLSLGGVGVHGTNAPGSIYRAATHGCIRMHPDDIAELFSQIQVGRPGRTIYEPTLLAVVGEQVFLEVHRDVYARMVTGLREHARALASDAGLKDRIDWGIADAVIAAAHGSPREVNKQR
jgi:L,D-transpeptidase ErfK/SrfK